MSVEAVEPTQPNCIKRASSTYTKCPCLPCTVERNHLAKVIRIYGPLPRVTSEDAWAALDWMQARGWHDHAITNVTGIPQITLRCAIKRRREDGHAQAWGAKHSAALVAGKSKHPSEGFIGSTGSMRRLRAMAVMGWSVTDFAAEIGTPAATLSHIKAGKGVGRVRAQTANRIRSGYDRLSARPGGAKITATLAKNAGWAPPAAWDYLNIDDPKTKPQGAGYELTPTERRAEIHRLNATGMDKHGIARTIGCRTRTVTRTLGNPQ